MKHTSSCFLQSVFSELFFIYKRHTDCSWCFLFPPNKKKKCHCWCSLLELHPLHSKLFMPFLMQQAQCLQAWLMPSVCLFPGASEADWLCGVPGYVPAPHHLQRLQSGQVRTRAWNLFSVQPISDTTNRKPYLSFLTVLKQWCRPLRHGFL